MHLTPKQRLVLEALTTEWLSPKQIADRLPEADGDPAYVNQSLKDLMGKGLVQTNPIVIGTYRLTSDGTAVKEMELDGRKES